MILDVLKYILVVLGIIAVGAFIIWGLVSLILVIVEPHGESKEQNTETYKPYKPESTVTYEPQQYIQERSQVANEYVQAPVVSEYVPENTEIKELDYAKAKEEEMALNSGSSFDQLTAEEEEFIREKQRKIEERLSSKTVAKAQITEEDEIDLDDIFIDDTEEEVAQPAIEDKPLDTAAKDDEVEDDIEALINKILDGEDEDEDEDEDFGDDGVQPQQEAVEAITEESVEIKEEVEELTTLAEEVAVVESVDAVEEPAVQEEVKEEVEEVVTEAALEEQVEQILVAPVVDDERIKELEEALARQKEEFETRIKEIEQAKDAELQIDEHENNAKIAELEEKLAEAENSKARIAELENMLAVKESEKESLIIEKERIIKETETKLIERKVGPQLPIEEYEQRLEILKERLKANERDYKVVKKEYLPLAKIKKTLEKDNKKLRRKEALVAKQKVVLYGVNNYVDIDEEKAKKLAEDLDLLEGLRLSVQHCEEVMKANAERYPLLENSYNILVETNANIKADIEECQSKIAELKAMQETSVENGDGEQE